jgi:hypothetical protein
MAKFNAKKGSFAEDSECWNIAESMMEEIEQIKGNSINNISANGNSKGNFKKMLMKRIGYS